MFAVWVCSEEALDTAHEMEKTVLEVVSDLQL